MNRWHRHAPTGLTCHRTCQAAPLSDGHSLITKERKKHIWNLNRICSYLPTSLADAFRGELFNPRIRWYVFPTPSSFVYPPSPTSPAAIELHNPGWKRSLLPLARLLGSRTLQTVLCGLALLHTPLNASLLLQHIIFADHKIHPQPFPGRTWH